MGSELVQEIPEDSKLKVSSQSIKRSFSVDLSKSHEKLESKISHSQVDEKIMNAFLENFEANELGD